MKLQKCPSTVKMTRFPKQPNDCSKNESNEHFLICFFTVCLKLIGQGYWMSVLGKSMIKRHQSSRLWCWSPMTIHPDLCSNRPNVIHNGHTDGSVYITLGMCRYVHVCCGVQSVPTVLAVIHFWAACGWSSLTFAVGRLQNWLHAESCHYTTWTSHDHQP